MDFTIPLLGAVQGITEFLPVSSSGHLALLQTLFGYGNLMSYDIVLHVATLLATLCYFRKDVKTFISDWIGGFLSPEARRREGWKYCWVIILGTVMTVVVAMPLKDFASDAMSAPAFVGVGLLITAAVLWLMQGKPNERGALQKPGAAEAAEEHQQPEDAGAANEAAMSAEPEEGPKCGVTYKSSIVVGLLQGIAVMPGISRSGLTIFGSLMCGLSAPEAFRLSFMLSVPAILGALVLDVFGALFDANAVWTLPSGWWLGAILSFVLGLISLRLLHHFVVSGHWRKFAYYCVMVAVVIFAASFIQWIF